MVALPTFVCCPLFFQVQHPRSRLERFDLVITPRHDYYSLTPEGKRQIPFFLRPWVTPREPPGRNVVCVFCNVYQKEFDGKELSFSCW